MKKFLFVFISLLTAVFTSNAQIKIEDTFANDLVIIGNISSGNTLNALAAANGQSSSSQEHKLYCRIFRDKVTYGILVDTQNKFDDDFEFALGTDIEKAKESINSITQFMKTKPVNSSFTAKDEDGRTIQINIRSRKQITLEAIDSKGAIVCNKVCLTQANLERALKLLDKKAEKKVKDRLERNK